MRKAAPTVLVVNCGSSSLKYGFYDSGDAARFARGHIERIALPGTRHRFAGPGGEREQELALGGYPEAFDAMLSALTGPSTGVLAGPDEVSLVAHRVVHGGEEFTGPTLITGEVLARIEALAPLAPLHNPVNLAGIRELRRRFPAVPHVAVFDTAFHHTLPPHAYLYGLPYAYYETHHLRRYGFHGTSHADVCQRAAEFLGRPLSELRIVSCHLGNGASLCAVEGGCSVDTTMGLTPLEGLIMGTRCGDIDPGALAFLERVEGLSASQSEQVLNTRSGLLGISGLSSDMREILAAAAGGHARARLALEAYAYRIRKYVGAFMAVMGGLDLIVFTGGIGQGSDVVRALALQRMDGLGVVLDSARNGAVRELSTAARVSADASRVAVVVVPADEERRIAQEALSRIHSVPRRRQAGRRGQELGRSSGRSRDVGLARGSQPRPGARTGT